MSTEGKVYFRWDQHQFRVLYGPNQQIVSISNSPPCRACLPTAPYIVVSGRVSKVSEQVIIEGSLLDFYPGEWTDDGVHVRSMLFDIQTKNRPYARPHSVA
jgi:hypothetical protein